MLADEARNISTTYIKNCTSIKLRDIIKSIKMRAEYGMFHLTYNEHLSYEEIRYLESLGYKVEDETKVMQQMGEPWKWEYIIKW